MKTGKSSKKSGNKMKSNLETQRELREKNAAKNSAAPKKQPAKAKPSKGKPAKVAKEKKGKGKENSAPVQDGFITGGAITELKAAANEIIPQIKSEVQRVSNALTDAVVLDQKLQDARERELWRYCDTPYKSWTAFVSDLKEMAGKSAATLFGIIGLQKALPGTTAEQRRAIGPRKGAKIAKAAKVAEKKGEILPPEIIDSAPDKTESEVEEDLRQAGFVEEPPAPPAETQVSLLGAPDALLANTAQNTMPFNPRKGGSGVVEGDSADAQQFSGVVQEAINAARVIYDGSFTDIEALEFVCKMYLLSPCEKENFEDTTNRAAADEIRKEAKSGKKSKTAHA